MARWPCVQAWSVWCPTHRFGMVGSLPSTSLPESPGWVNTLTATPHHSRSSTRFSPTAIWAAIPTHTSRAVSVLRNSRCWKKPSVFACLSTFARKINSASWWSSPRACPSKIRTKSTMVWKEKLYPSRPGGERTRSGGERTLWRAPYFDQLAQFRPRACRANRKTSLVWPWLGQSRTNLRWSKALRWSVRLSIVDTSFCSSPDSADIVKTSLLACS